MVCNTDEGGKRGSGKTKSGKDASAERLQGMQGAILHQQKRYLGEWHEEREQFLPGYVFLITDDFGEASQLFQEIAEFVRLLGYGKEAPRRERGGKALRKACRGMG